MLVELFLLEENQITHTFWKLLMTAFQSASGWLSVMICIFIYSSYIKKFTPVRSWQSVSIFNLFGENSLLADIIQISFYQKSGWHKRWRCKKYTADKQRILMRDRDYFCASIKGMEITILIPDTLNCTWSPWVIVRRRHKCQLQNFLYYPGWHQNFYFHLEITLGVRQSSSVNKSPRKQAGGWSFLLVHLLIAKQTFVPPSHSGQRRGCSVQGVQGDAQVWDCLCIQPSPDLKLLWKGDTRKDAYYSSQNATLLRTFQEKGELCGSGSVPCQVAWC